jgi:hypothetical protein
MTDNTTENNFAAYVRHQQNITEQLQAQIAALEAAATAAAAAAATPAVAPTIDVVPSRFSEPKTSAPPTFDGSKPRDCRPFLNHCRINFQTQPSRFLTDHSKIFYTIGYLRGSAFELIEPYLDEARHLERPTWLNTFATFADHLNNAFGIVDEAQQAERRLRNLQQTGSASQYYTRFLALASLLDWDDHALRSQFYFGLKPHIKDDLAHHERPTTLTALKDLAIRVDNRLFERFQERKEERSTVSNPSNPPPRFTAPAQPRIFAPRMPATGPTPMDIDALTSPPPRGPLSAQEKQRRRQLNLCLYCGQPSHMAYACPLKPQPRAQAAELNITLQNGGDENTHAPEN